MRRLILALLGAILALPLLAVPAHASLTDREVRQVAGGPRSGYVQSTVHYESQRDGTGYFVREIEIECYPLSRFEGGTQVNTIELDLYVRDGGEKRWSGDNGDITSGCHRSWYPDARVPERGGSLHWRGVAKLDTPYDEGFKFWNPGPYSN